MTNHLFTITMDGHDENEFNPFLITPKSSIDICHDFDTQYAYVVKNKFDVPDPKNRITIIEYLNNTKLRDAIRNESKYLVCANKHDLIKYESEQKKSYFRHKHNEYGGMSEWHKNWQNQFDDTEIKIGDRRADAIVHDNVLEFQHSIITKELVGERHNNYTKYNKNLLWIIECTKCIQIYELASHNTFLILFTADQWKYKNFTTESYVYLDNGEYIYKIDPKKVKSGMLDVREKKQKKIS